MAPTTPPDSSTDSTETTDSRTADSGIAETGSTGPSAQPPPPAAGHPTGNRFFAWMRSLGLNRQPGWIGGVCSGIAARLDIDPLIVRGIVVVVAVLGGPAFILYAAAWLLLPDENDSIHLENLVRGKVQSPIAGIGGLVLLFMLPMAQGFWYLGYSFWGDPTWGYDLGRALWTVVILAALVAFVVWIARRASRTDASTPTFTPATTDGRPETVPEPFAPDVADPSTAALTTPVLPTAPLPHPAAPARDASAEELAAWRASQEQWRQQNQEFRNAQAASQRAIRQQRAAEYRERARLSAVEAAERRRIRRLENPRLSAPIVLAVLGAAIVAGGMAATAVSLGAATSSIAAAVGFSVAALIMGGAIVVGGVMRHRSGFLAFLAGVTLLLALVMTAVPTGRTLVPPIPYGVGVGNFAQPFGTAYVTAYEGMPEGLTDIWQASGTVSISLDQGTAVTVELASPASAVTMWANAPDGMAPEVIDPVSTSDDGVQHWSFTVGDPAATDVRTVRVWQSTGYLEIIDNSMTNVEE